MKLRVNSMDHFNSYLRSLYPVKLNRIQEAELYSLLAGGKRIRPNLLFKAAKGYGISEDVVFPIGASIEMIHTYSLIHDDLPAMDDDDLRRGNPTCHKMFDEDTAILAGDALLTKAFEILAKTEYKHALRIIAHIAKMAGDTGMICGQMLDIESEGIGTVNTKMLNNIHLHKTGCLIATPLVCAALAAERIKDIEKLEAIGMTIGLAFQVQDDILDEISTKEVLGKSTSDSINNKATYVCLHGVDEATKLMNQLYSEAIDALHEIDFDSKPLESLLNEMISRKN